MARLLIDELADQQAREDALDIRCSVLVQAPAGSGKTELLAMRFLKLLAVVEEPEEVLGITFTKAATAEIRHRILGKLEKARDFLATGIAPQGEDSTSLEIATAAITNSNERGWRLLAQPHRLDIQTIDSLGLRIAHLMPLSGRPGGMLQPTEAATDLYRRAARRTLDRLGGDDEELSTALRGLLLLRDSNLDGCEMLLAKMLATRDQWSRAFPMAGEIDWSTVRNRLEQPFQREIERVLGELHTLLSSHPALTRELLELADYACQGENLKIEIRLLGGMNQLPSPSPEFLDHWSCFVSFLLTEEDEMRKAYNTGHGFPPKTAEKARILELVPKLGQISSLVELLAEIRGLPRPRYTDSHWANLCHILVVLRSAVSELRTVFVEQGVVDFVEVGMSALDVLRADAQGRGIQHLLIDEFQDTSRSQHELVAVLLRSWGADSAQDRRTLFDAPRTVFLVGDPMQSIYLFRQADVELFTQVRDRGLTTGSGQLSVKPLDITTNFRSHAGLVGPLNAMFETVFPYEVKHGSADVGFLRSTPKNAASPVGAYQIHADFMTSEKSSRDEAQQRETDEILKIIRRHQPRIDEARDQDEEFTVVVLARAKNHLIAIAAALREEGIPFRAVDLEELGERQEILDLQSLTRALLHPMDRIAWLSMLRSPWCGLELSDLHLLCGTDARCFEIGPILAQIHERVDLLGQDQRERVSRMFAIVQRALDGRYRQPSLSSWIERTWNSLGGPACVDAAGFENAQSYFRMLDEISLDGIDATGETMKARLNRLHAKSDPSVSDRCGVQLMTMHKAKGLGFNVVVLPGLNKPVSRDPFSLIRYLERSTGPETELLVAPIGNKGEEPSPVYGWVGRQKQNREAEERKRLLYVACTRAREELHLFGTVVVTDRKLAPNSGSLLHTAWPALESVFIEEYVRRSTLPQAGSVLEFPATHADEMAAGVLDKVAAASSKTRLCRLPSKWRQTPTSSNIVFATRKAGTVSAAVESELQRPHGSYSSRILGTTVHVLFERAAQELGRGSSAADLRAELPVFRSQANTLCRNGGLMPQEISAVASSAVEALENTLADPIGLWILDSQRKSQTELSWTGVIGDTSRTLRIDRSFLAGPEPLLKGDSCLWVIDYKTANHGPSGIEEFLDAEKLQYASQLESYAQILRLAHGSEIQLRVGLYYPFLTRLIWWAA